MFDGFCVKDEGCVVPRRGGVVGIVAETGWGPVGEPVRYMHSCGCVPSAAKDALLCASEVVCVRPDGGEYASCAFGRARYKGSFGNGIILTCSFDGSLYEVAVYVNGAFECVQYVHGADELLDDDFVVYDRGCGLFETAGMPMTGGADVVLNADAYAAAVGALGDGVDVIVCENAELAPTAVERVRVLRGEGANVRCVVVGESGEYGDDFVSVMRSCDGGAVFAVAGAVAAASFYGTASGFWCECDGAGEVVSVGKARELAARGVLSFVSRRGRAVLWRDVTATGRCGQSARISDEIGARVRGIFDEKYRGRAAANEGGVESLKRDVEAMMQRLHRVYGCVEPGYAVAVSANAGVVNVNVDAIVSAAVGEFVMTGGAGA